MGYRPYYTNAFAVVLYREFGSNDPANTALFNHDEEIYCDLNGAFEDARLPCLASLILDDGGDSRIHGGDLLVMFTDFTKCTFEELDGDITKEPDATLIQQCRDIVERFGFVWVDPERTERSYIF